MCEFQASLLYIMSSGPAWAKTVSRCSLKKQDKTKQVNKLRRTERGGRVGEERRKEGEEVISTVNCGRAGGASLGLSRQARASTSPKG